MTRMSWVLILAGALAAPGGVGAVPVTLPIAATSRLAAEPVQAFCGPNRCFARPVWRYRSGAGFLPYRRFGFAPPGPRFAPFGFRRFGGYGDGRFGGFRPSTEN